METYDVFISYSRKDTKIADKICEAFDKAGITYFIDRQGIGGGMEFPAVLAKAIRESKVFLFLASKNSYESKFTQSEIVYAFNKKEKQDIIPYIIDGSKLPEALEFTFSAINWRNINQHPIETVLVGDVMQRIGKDVAPEMKPQGFRFTGKLMAQIVLGMSIAIFLFVLISNLASAAYMEGRNNIATIISMVFLLIATVLFLIGIIRPKSLEINNRKDIFKFYLSSLFILFISVGMAAGTEKGIDSAKESFENFPSDSVIDLGLPSGTLWASFNLGAKDLSDIGNHYAWGDLIASIAQPKPTHDNLVNIVGTVNDVAFTSLGNHWRLPTETQFSELINCCEWKWTMQNGFNGCLVIGPNGNSMFLPAAGCIIKNKTKYQQEFGYYWTGISIERYPEMALELLFGADTKNIESGKKNIPRSIRPVYLMNN